MRRQRYRFIWMLAKRDIVSDRKISLIVVFMLGFSYLNLTFFPAFIDGLSNSFTSDLIETQTGHVSIQPSEGKYLDNADAVAAKVARLEGVTTVEKRIEFTAAGTFRDETVPIQMVGTSAVAAPIYTSRVRDGAFLRRGDDTKIVLGNELADEGEQFGIDGLGVTPGRIIHVSTANFTRAFQVAGSIGRPGASSLTRQGFVTYTAAERLLGLDNQATAIHLILTDRSESEAVKQRLQSLNVQGDIKTWRERSNIVESFNQTFAIVTAVISLVGIIIAITSIGVVIFINTNKRTREMGILRAIGTEATTVSSIFILEAFLFAVLGLIVGNLFIIGIDTYLAYNPIKAPIGTLQTAVTQDLLVTRSIWILVAALVAGFLPSYLITKRRIVDTIEVR